jgi:GNAT superfamily N-acetyltransferase
MPTEAMELCPITCPEDLLNEELRCRARDGSKTTVTKHFVAIEGGIEVAFVALDILPAPVDHLVLYELVVPKELRGHGIGSRTLLEVERLAREWKYIGVLLRPKPLDDHWSSERLKVWYSKRGYRPRSDDLTTWTKMV